MIINFFNAHPIFFIYLAVINTITIFVYGADKIFAVAHAWRVRERTLLILALLGGSVGALVGAYLFRHKTKKTSFLLFLAAIVLVQLIGVLYIFTLNYETVALSS